MAEYTEVFPFGVSSVGVFDINTDDWSQSQTLTADDAPAGWYMLTIGLSCYMPALSYQLEWRVSGVIERGVYTLVGGAVPAWLPYTLTSPFLHNGGALSITLAARIPALGFNVLLEDVFLTAHRVG